MFTSRAEYRLTLREDNADLRLTEIGRELGLVDEQRWRAFSEKQEIIAREQQRLANTWIQADSAAAKKLNSKLKNPLSHEYNLADLLKRPELTHTVGELLAVDLNKMSLCIKPWHLQPNRGFHGVISPDFIDFCFRINPLHRQPAALLSKQMLSFLQ